MLCSSFDFCQPYCGGCGPCAPGGPCGPCGPCGPGVFQCGPFGGGWGPCGSCGPYGFGPTPCPLPTPVFSYPVSLDGISACVSPVNPCCTCCLEPKFSARIGRSGLIV